jgi:hypothetical protein
MIASELTAQIFEVKLNSVSNLQNWGNQGIRLTEHTE